MSTNGTTVDSTSREARLEAARKRSEAARKRIAAREDDLELARAERDATDDEAFDSLQHAHGAEKVLRVEVPTPVDLPGIVVFREPGDDFKAFIAITSKPSAKHSEKLAAQTDLVVQCAIYPDRPVLERMLAVKLGIAGTLGIEILRWVGGLMEAKGKE